MAIAGIDERLKVFNKEKKMTRKAIELTDEVDQSEPPGYLVFTAHSVDNDYVVFGCLAAAEHYAADQQEAAEEDGWPIYPLYATHALDWGV